jgi:hypothetical protein
MATVTQDVIELNTCYFYDFKLEIIAETDTEFVLSNCGESVGLDDAINMQFMLIKDALGFIQTDRGTFQNTVSKFSSQLRVKAEKLVCYDGGLIRVLLENAHDYLLIALEDPQSSRAEKGWQALDGGHIECFIKWVRHAETEAVEAFIGYWDRQAQK